MTIKTLFIGCVTACVLASSAYATDAVVADPDQSQDTQQATACDAYGPGFIQAPGTGTCVKVSGQLRYEQSLSGTSMSHGRTTLDFETRSD